MSTKHLMGYRKLESCSSCCWFCVVAYVGQLLRFSYPISKLVLRRSFEKYKTYVSLAFVIWMGTIPVPELVLYRFFIGYTFYIGQHCSIAGKWFDPTSPSVFFLLCSVHSSINGWWLYLQTDFFFCCWWKKTLDFVCS